MISWYFTNTLWIDCGLATPFAEYEDVSGRSQNQTSDSKQPLANRFEALDSRIENYSRVDVVCGPIAVATEIDRGTTSRTIFDRWTALLGCNADGFLILDDLDWLRCHEWKWVWAWVLASNTFCTVIRHVVFHVFAGRFSILNGRAFSIRYRQKAIRFSFSIGSVNALPFPLVMIRIEVGQGVGWSSRVVDNKNVLCRYGNKAWKREF